MTQKQRALRQEQIRWRSANRGKLSQIARSLGLSAVFVSDVFYRRRTSSSGFVEAALADAGAPGFEKQPAEGRRHG